MKHLYVVFLLVAICSPGCQYKFPERALVEPAIVSAAIELEKELDAREGVAVPEGETWFKVVEGTIPVIITAPHATRPLRNGKRRFSDGGGTAALAVALGELTGATVMYTTYEGDSDPNYYDDNVFKEKLKELIDRIKPEYVLDLHGSHSYRSYDIDLGTMRDRSLLGRTKLVKMLIEHLKRENIANISYNRFSASKHETVTKFSSANGVPAIQMEINMTWISPKDGWIEAQRFSILAQAMTRFILTAKK